MEESHADAAETTKPRRKRWKWKIGFLLIFLAGIAVAIGLNLEAGEYHRIDY